MKIALVVPPGRLPTVVHDYGDWSSALPYAIDLVHLNEIWWSSVLGADGEMLRDRGTYERADIYVETMTALEHRAFARYGAAGPRCTLPLGPVFPRVDYERATTIGAIASEHHALRSDLREILCDRWVSADLVLFAVTSHIELANAAIIASLLRELGAARSIGIVDHGYENFSLHANLAAFSAEPLRSIFDFIVASRDDRAGAVARIIADIEGGKPVRGIISSAMQASATSEERPAFWSPAVFAPESRTPRWMRLSERRCYYDRCVFCVQNVKLAADRGSVRAEVDIALRRVAAAYARGQRLFIFSDEALSPAFLRDFCSRVVDVAPDIAWACRCKVERQFDDELIRLMRRAGCYEVLFGLESVSAHVLTLMDKFSPPLGPDEIANLCNRFVQAGIGLHLNFIIGFPGERAEDAAMTSRWLVSHGREWPGMTYLLNDFALFAGSAMAADPEKYGITIEPTDRDLVQSLPFRGPVHQLGALLPQLYEAVDRDLGWRPPDTEDTSAIARHFYFASGHGAIMKASGPKNPFAFGPYHRVAS